MAWDYTKTEYDKQAMADPRWRLERIINGQDEGRLDRELLKKYLPELKISEDRRAFLELLLWNKKF